MNGNQDVQHWDEWNQELTHAQRSKARKFVDLGLIRYEGHNHFCAYPIEGYNTTPHSMMNDREFGFRCSCQGFVMKERLFRAGLSPNKPFCSHIHALYLAFSRKLFNNGGEHD